GGPAGVARGRGRAEVGGERVARACDRAVPAALDGARAAAFVNHRRDAPDVAGVDVGRGAVLDEAEAAVALEIFALEGLPDVGRLQLLAGLVGDALDDLAELDLEAARQAQAVALLEDVGDAALAGLAVD